MHFFISTNHVACQSSKLYSWYCVISETASASEFVSSKIFGSKSNSILLNSKPLLASALALALILALAFPFAIALAHLVLAFLGVLLSPLGLPLLIVLGLGSTLSKLTSVLMTLVLIGFLKEMTLGISKVNTLDNIVQMVVTLPNFR